MEVHDCLLAAAELSPCVDCARRSCPVRSRMFRARAGSMRLCGPSNTGHLTALVRTRLARQAARLAVFHLELRALSPASVADIGAELAQGLRLFAAARHELGSHAADGGAVEVHADAVGHLGDVLLAEARLRAHVARLRALQASVDAGLKLLCLLLSLHNVLSVGGASAAASASPDVMPTLAP